MALGPPGTMTPSDRQRGVAALALLSLAAGFLHAAVIDAHRDHGIAPGVFTAIALFQIAWAGAVMAKASRPLLAVGAVVNLAIVVGWVVSRTTGIGFLDGFQDAEPVGFTDAVITALEVLLVLGAGVLALAPPARRLWPAGHGGTAGLAAVGLAVALVSVPAAAEAGSAHEGAPAGGDHAAHTGSSSVPQGESNLRLQVGGITVDDAFDVRSEVATPEEVEAAQELLDSTVAGLWQWTDPEKVREAGFRPIGDDGSGFSQYVNWEWVNDDLVLDPAHPEALVYRETPQGRVLEAALYMAPAGTPESQVPDVGGPITRWHVHDDVCYSPAEMVDGAPERRVLGSADDSGACVAGERLEPPSPLLYVWVVSRRCGPFSPIETVTPGQVIDEVRDPTTDEICQRPDD